MSLNANPVVFGDGHRRVERAVTDPGFVEDCRDPIDAEEIFDVGPRRRRTHCRLTLPCS